MTRIAPPLTPWQAARIEPLGLLADEPAGLLAAWSKVEGFWAETVAEARRLDEEQLNTRVKGEWSFIETLRHLINVTDAWIGDLVLEKPSPYDPIGLPPDFFTPGPELGLDLDARPSLAHVLDTRSRRMVETRETIAHATVDGLDRLCARLGGQVIVLGAFQNVIFEEWAHHSYAIRDLALVMTEARVGLDVADSD
jgi:DinB superfamily